jgi:hypothetical protein
MWVKFTSQRPYAIQVFVGRVNAVSGCAIETKNERIQRLINHSQHREAMQDYLVVPDQMWIDGIAVAPGQVRQFVAMPTGSGYSVEMQVTGREELAGILFSVTPRVSPSWSGGFHGRHRTARIRIAQLGHDVFTMLVSPKDTVDDVKFLIQDQQRISATHQELLIASSMLEGGLVNDGSTSVRPSTNYT